MQDGVLETFTGAMLEPYLGRTAGPSDQPGSASVEPERLRAG